MLAEHNRPRANHTPWREGWRTLRCRRISAVECMRVRVLVSHFVDVVATRNILTHLHTLSHHPDSEAHGHGNDEDDRNNGDQGLGRYQFGVSVRYRRVCDRDKMSC